MFAAAGEVLPTGGLAAAVNGGGGMALAPVATPAALELGMRRRSRKPKCRPGRVAGWSAAGVAVLAVAACLLLWPAARRNDGTSTSSEVDMRTPRTPATKMSSPLGEMPPLTSEEKSVIVDKGTERPFTGKYWDSHDAGVYVCRRCGAPLYLSDAKFDSQCGWPSFDDEIAGAVVKTLDADGSRTEITCANCGGHLGHVFVGEALTPKDTRHCVNSASLVFVPREKWPLERAIFAGGCFWGVDYHFRQMSGVLAVRSGYTGGRTQRPTYQQVCAGNTGHAESVEVLFDPAKVTYEQLARRFFEIHDPTELNRQGPDVGSQCRSAVFYTSDEQKKTAEKLIALLRDRGCDAVTELAPAGTFWAAEDYHQDYIGKHPDRACHAPVERFGPATQPAAAPAK